MFKCILDESGGWWRWALLSPDGAAPNRMVTVPASVDLPLHHKDRGSLLAPAHPGGPRKRAIKWLWLSVVVVVVVVVVEMNII